MAVLCSNCSGKLIFNPASQRLECVSCGSKFRPEDVEDINAKANSKYYDTRVYVCGHCGAEVVTSDTEVSTFCIYCGNPAIVFSRVSKEYRPDGLIPFKVTKQDAVKKIRAKFSKNPIIPKEVKDKIKPENLRGIYIPYWIVNCDFAETDFITGEVKRGKRTVTLNYSRAGDASFMNVPCDGSNSLNDELSMKLEPFYLEDSRSFDEDYLNGFYSNTSDLDLFSLRSSAAARCHRLYADEVVKTVNANNVKINDSIYWVDIKDDPVYMMLPVWFLTFRYNELPHTILVNGQTGKVVGTMPWKKKHITWIAVISFFVVLTLLAVLFKCMFSVSDTIRGFASYIALGLGFAGLYGLPKGLAGISKIVKNLELTRSEIMFRYVKRRQDN